MSDEYADGVLVLQVTSARYADDNPAWRSQVNGLAGELARLADGTVQAGCPVLSVASSMRDPAGEDPVHSKGAELITLLSLPSVQLIRSAALVVREWLNRDKSRSVSLVIEAGDGKIAMSGQGIHGIEAAERAFRAALEGGYTGESDGQK